MTIQEQVEHYKLDVRSHINVDPCYADIADRKLDSILRQVVEECCKEECVYCEEGLAVELVEGDYYHVTEEEDCFADAIRRQFDWLLK